MSYIHKEINTKKLKLDESVIRIYPIVCMHVGSPQADLQFLKEHIKRIQTDPNALWVYMGDGGECVTMFSKGDIYGQLLNPQLQLELLVDLLTPIKNKGWFGIRGNHGNRVYKETGLSFDHNLMSILGLPYLGVKAMANLVVNRSSYDLWFHHGIDSGITVTAKVAKAEQFGKFVNADALFTAHSHVCMALQPAAIYEADNIGQKLSTRLRYQYICGCAYDSRTGYADDKGYPPLLPSYLYVEFNGRIIEGYAQHGQDHRVFRSDGKRGPALKHNYLVEYLNRENID